MGQKRQNQNGNWTISSRKYANGRSGPTNGNRAPKRRSVNCKPLTLAATKRTPMLWKRRRQWSVTPRACSFRQLWKSNCNNSSSKLMETMEIIRIELDGDRCLEEGQWQQQMLLEQMTGAPATSRIHQRQRIAKRLSPA